MEDLRVIGVDGNALVVSTETGNHFRLAVDESLTQKLKQMAVAPDTSPRVSPREIQAQIRSGMSAQDVASTTGASLEYIERFERPILAEREFVVESALSIAVHTAMDSEFGNTHETFGSAIHARLEGLNATHERWASWKDETHGWVVKLSFTANQVDHDARWRFDPRNSALAPLNNEAETLSRQGELTGTLIPRLRAVDDHNRVADNSRFDSGAFVDHELSELRSSPPLSRTPVAETDTQNESESNAKDTAPHLEAVPYGRVGADESPPTNHTADLLEALRRRRGERESASFDDMDDAKADHPSTGNIRIVDIPLTDFNDEPSEDSSKTASIHEMPAKPPKRGRAAMPSWDDIVFGARSDDDPA